MNRAERRRQQKIADKEAKKSKIIPSSSSNPTHQTLTTEQSVNIALKHHLDGDFSKADSIYHEILQIDPHNIDALHLSGVVAHENGENNRAAELILKAIAINADIPDMHYNLGNVYRQLGKLDDAVSCYLNAIALRPDYIGAYNNLGIVYNNQGNAHSAIECYNKIIAINPDFADVYNNLGLAFNELGKLDNAAINYQKAIAIDIDFHEAYGNLGTIYMQTGRQEEAIIYFRKAFTINPKDYKSHSGLIFSMSYVPKISSKDIYEESCSWSARHCYKDDIAPHQNTPEPERRLRIGFVSGDLNSHAVSFFLENIFSEFNKEELDIFAYSTSVIEDSMTTHLKSMVPFWRKVVGIGDMALANNIRADKIDILVDLSGHLKNNRLKMFSHKPAPIQVTWLGFGGTTGVKAIDYILSDKFVIPPSEEACFVEKPWRLPDVWVCFSPPKLDVKITPLPAFDNNFITFGSFNNLPKISDRTVACWAKVLQAIPDSRLLLKTKQLTDKLVCEEIYKRFEVYGIERHRLSLKSFSPDMAEHFQTYNEIDIALDPFPYSGGTTSVDALWMGKPVLGLKGDRFVACMGESFLNNMDLEEWIADTPDDYVEKAVAFTSNLSELSLLSENLRKRLLASPICDASRFTRNLENAFRGMWREWCDTKDNLK